MATRRRRSCSASGGSCRATPCGETSRPSPRTRRCRGPGARHAGRGRRGLRRGPRSDGEAPLRASGRGGVRLQPAEARTPVALLPHAVRRETEADARGRRASRERDVWDAFAVHAGGIPRVRLRREEAPPRAGGRVVRERVGDRGLRGGGRAVPVQDEAVEGRAQGLLRAAFRRWRVARLIRRVAVRGAGHQARFMGEGPEDGVCAAPGGEDSEEEEDPPQRKLTQLDIPGLELVEAGDENYADGYEWYALVTDLANLWNVFTRLGDDGTHREAATSSPLLQSCVARLSRHARQGIVTIYTATCEKAHKIYRAISAFLSRISAASQLSVEERRQRIVAHAFRKYGTIRRLPPDIGGQMTMPLT